MTPEQLRRLPKVLFEIGKAIGSGEDLRSLFTHISELVVELLGADACSVMLLDARKERLITKAAFGLPAERIAEITFKLGEGVAGWVVQNGRPALIDDVHLDSRFITLRDSTSSIASMACVPVTARDEHIGALTATSGNPEAFNEDDIELLNFVARTIALDVENVRLRKLSVTDPLTGCYNREFLNQRLPVEISEAIQRHRPLSVAMIDVDHFKSVNDRFGHDVGDRVLAEVAERLRSGVRADDLLVRYGGEEFMVVLPNADSEIAFEIAERMRLKLQEEAINVGEDNIEVRISAGVAQLRGPEERDIELIRRADTSLYIAKGHGRNRVEVAS
jgi:diguanylate cyclase (GGDEF)-like protein